MPDSRPLRIAVPVDQTWNLNDIFATPEEWERALGATEALTANVTAFRGRLGESGEALLACLRARDALMETLHRVDTYARLGSAADGLDRRNQAMSARAQAAGARIQAATSFLLTELVALPSGTVECFLGSTPDLAIYRLQLEDALRRRNHVLSPDAEEALAALGEALELPSAIWRRTTANDLVCPPARDENGAEHLVTIATVQFGQKSAPDRALRRSAHEALAAGLDRHKATLATGLAAHIKKNVTLARLRRYPSATEMILAPQRISADIYRMVMDRVHDGIAPHARRMVRLRQRLLGLDKVWHYDVDAPLDPDFEPPKTIVDAAELIREGLRPLGSEYIARISRAFDERWIDLAQNQGKQSGAFCASVYGVHPYVFTTWQDTLRNVFLLAHELGHGGHGIYGGRTQVISNARAGLFFVEAPSTINEVLLGRHLLRTTTDRRARLHVALQFMGTFTHNMITHMLEAHFERRLYDLAEEGRPITVDAVLDAQAAVFERFYDGTVATDDGARLYWAQQPHFYVNHYPYTYAAGLAVGCAIADAIEREGEATAERWLATLSLGGTLPPLELAAYAGVDMSRPEAIESAVGQFGRLVDEVEAAFATKP
ncbi:MAG: oligoendopeptidase F [Chloroflexota bacterium]|nr:MAG: oligoendopeptidase F [Chloroflexota bacterium]